MIKYPLVVQEEYKDCGVACLEMVIKYYGGYVKMNTLFDLTKTNKKGTTAYHLKEALIALGFQAKGVSATLDQMSYDNIILPCIANVTINREYKHFVVIYEINFKKQYLIIGDPMDKVKKMSFIEFSEIYNNVLITFFPIKTLAIDKEIPFTNFIFKLVIPHKKILFNIFMLSFFITLFSIITSFYTEQMINATFSKNNLLLIFYIFLTIYILKILSDYFRNRALSFINQKIDLVLTLDIFNNIVNLPYRYYKSRNTGDVLSRINDLENVREMISKVALSLFIDLPLAIVSLIVLYIINASLFKVGIIIILLYFVVILLFRFPFKNYIKKIQSKKSEATSYMIESISGYETVKGLHIEDNIIDKFEKKYVCLLKDLFKFQNLYFLQNMLKDIINNIGFVVIIFVGCILVNENKIKLGTLFTFTSLLIYFLEPIKNIINLDSVIREAKNSIKRVLDLVVYNNSNDGVVKKFENRDIVFKNLKYSFNDRNYVLKNINLTIKKGSKVMVVGKSGSGKSTLFKILMKYYNINNNMVYINNIDLNNYKKSTIDSNIIYIGQNEILFNDTLYNNLIFFNSDSSRLLDVSKICCLDDIIDSNLGFNTLILENGENLSGGERQRIILARALLKNFNILIIDEGLSQVDVDMERIILKSVINNYKDKTIIFISHRLDNLDLFNELIKMKDGKILEG